MGQSSTSRAKDTFQNGADLDKDRETFENGAVPDRDTFENCASSVDFQ